MFIIAELILELRHQSSRHRDGHLRDRRHRVVGKCGREAAEVEGHGTSRSQQPLASSLSPGDRQPTTVFHGSKTGIRKRGRGLPSIVLHCKACGSEQKPVFVTERGKLRIPGYSVCAADWCRVRPLFSGCKSDDVFCLALYYRA